MPAHSMLHLARFALLLPLHLLSLALGVLYLVQLGLLGLGRQHTCNALQGGPYADAAAATSTQTKQAYRGTRGTLFRAWVP
jgi:hypothetical protein